MVGLKRKHKLRLFIDESISFGVLGATGRGITEHLSISMDDVDLIIATLEYAIGSIGGFCVGNSYVVEHQTLAGLGYCFSASLPPMLAAGALKAIELIENNHGIFGELQGKAELVHDQFDQMPGLQLSGDRISPVKHLRLENPESMSREGQKAILHKIVIKARERGVALTTASYLEDAETHLPLPSIRLTCSVLLEDELIIEAGKVVQQICKDIFE